jgi:hypothetical protein
MNAVLVTPAAKAESATGPIVVILEGGSARKTGDALNLASSIGRSLHWFSFCSASALTHMSISLFYPFNK